MKSKTERPGYEECVGVSRFLLKLIGVWPESHGKGNFFERNYVFVTPTVIFFILIVPQANKLLIVWRDLDEAIDILSIALMIIIICLLKFLRIWYNHADLTILLGHIYNDWETMTEEEQRIALKNARYSRLIVILGISSVIFNCIVLTIISFVQYYFELKSSPENMTIPKPLILNADYFFDIQSSPTWELLNFMQFYGIIICSCIYAAYDGVFVLATLHYSAQFNNLQRKIEILVEERAKYQCSFSDILVPVINRHEYLCRTTALIEKNFNVVFLIQILSTSIHLCLQGYQFVSILSTYGLEKWHLLLYTTAYVGTSLFSLFIYCFIAEQLRINSENMFISISKIEWYKLSPCDSKLLIMMMIRTEKPIDITAGKFSALSLEYFCTILKACARFFSVLLAMRDKLIQN